MVKFGRQHELVYDLKEQLQNLFLKNLDFILDITNDFQLCEKLPLKEGHSHRHL